MSESVSGSVVSNSSTIQTTVSTGRGGGGRGVQQQQNGSGRSNQGNRNRPNRGANRNRNNANGNNTTTVNNRSNFKGNTSDMNNHVFECCEERGDRTQFQKTVEALGEYAAKNLKFPEDLKTIFEDTITAPTLTMPADIADTASKTEQVIWEASLKSYARRKEELQSNLTTLYALIWGQCSDAMRNKLRALDDFPAENKKNNCIWLLKEIKGVTHKFDTKRHAVMSLIDAQIVFLLVIKPNTKPTLITWRCSCPTCKSLSITRQPSANTMFMQTND
jgi:hypothetical protein